MSAKIGALLVDMAMNTAAFASDLSKSQSALKNWATTSNKTLAGVVNGYRSLSGELKDLTLGAFTLRNALLSVVGGGAMGLFINKQIEAASAVVDTADNIGVTTKTLQEYTYAARLSSIGTDQLQNSLKTFATAVGQAHAGTGKLYTFLKESNPVLLQQVMSAKSVDEALNDVFNTMGRLGSQTDRLALTSAAFGKKNLEMVNLVKDGVPAFEALRQKANDLGIVIRDDLLRNAEAAGDKIETLSQVFKAQLIVAVASNAEAIGHFAEELTKAIPVIIELATQALHFVNILADEWEPTTIKLGLSFTTMAIKAQEAFIATKGIVTGGWSEATAKIKELEDLANHAADEALDRLNKVGKAAQMPGTGDASPATQQAIKNTNDYAAKMKLLADETNAAGESFKKLKDAADKIKQDHQGAFQNYLNDIAQLDKMLKANLLTWEEYTAAVADAQEKNFHIMERTKKVLGDTQNAQEKYNAQMKELNELRGVQGGLSEEQYQQAVAKTNAELRKAQMEGSLFGDIMDKAIDVNIKSWKDLGAAVVDFGKTLLKNLINGQGLGNAFGGSSGGGLFGGLGSLFGSFFGGGGGNSFSQGLGFLSNGGYGPFPSFFHGGGMVGSAGGMSRRVNPSVFANAPRFHGGGLVGGEVPIIAKKGERVLTEQQQKNMGGTVVYNIDARGADAGVEQRLRAMIMEVHQQVPQRAVSAVQSARARNPQLFSGAA